MSFYYYLSLVDVDPTIQITLEMIRDEQLSNIITGSYFKCIIDILFYYSKGDL